MFHIETSHLFCSANQIQMTGSYMKHNTGLKWINDLLGNLKTIVAKSILGKLSRVRLVAHTFNSVFKFMTLSLRLNREIYKWSGYFLTDLITE